MQLAKIRAIAVVSTLVLAAIVLIVITLQRDSQDGATAMTTCPSGNVPISLTLPNVDALTINVYNATKELGVASKVASDFRDRGVKVDKTGNSKTALPDQVAQLRYGPEGVAAAHVLQGFFLGDAQRDFKLDRKGATVDVYIGAKYQQLATPTEFNQAIGAMGRPSPPPGTCGRR